MKFQFGVAALVGAAGIACAGPVGDPNDMYFLSDAHSEVYQFERTPPWNHVPGNHVGGLGGTFSQVFSNSTQLTNNSPYLGAVAGANNDFFVGGFNGLVKINSTNGNFIQTVAGGARLGPAEAPNGNVVVGGPSGLEEFDSNTGAFVRTINNYGNGNNLVCFSGNTMYATTWTTFGSPAIKQFDFITGLPTGPDIAVPFSAQEIAIGPDGALYASGLYEGPSAEGVHRWNGSSWSFFADTNPLSGTGPHGFAWDPVNNDLYLAMQTGEIFRFNGLTGAYINQPGFVPTKLTDVLFHEVVPAPGALALFGFGAFAVNRRRRN